MLSKNSPTNRWLHRLPWRAFARWWIVGLAFYLAGLAILYLLIDIVKAPLLLGTLLMAESTTVVRYAINDRWVFEEGRLSWRRFYQFHIASAGGFFVWWTVVNILPRLGVHYLLASTVGTASSMLWSIVTNFLWIWRKRATAVLREDSQPVANPLEAANGR